MQIFETTQNLIDEHFDMIDGERLRRDDYFVQIGLHKFGEHIAAMQFVGSMVVA